VSKLGDFALDSLGCPILAPVAFREYVFLRIFRLLEDVGRDVVVGIEHLDDLVVAFASLDLVGLAGERGVGGSPAIVVRARLRRPAWAAACGSL